jgi:predicted unusual protein kinase regulating ubiquinone biosynthesis (AarF/ABC1/UbiB family)
VTDKAAENPIQNAKLAMDCISVYGSILKDNVMEKLYELLNSLYYPENDISCFLRRYSAFCGSFLENSEGRSLRLYILELLLSDDNAENIVQAVQEYKPLFLKAGQTSPKEVGEHE